MSTIRHGEAALVKIGELPKGTTKKVRTHLIAHSETGHHHVLESEVDFEVLEDNEDLYLRLFEPAKLVQKKQQERHNDLVLEPGVYKRYVATEYNPFTKIVQQVWD